MSDARADLYLAQARRQPTDRRPTANSSPSRGTQVWLFEIRRRVLTLKDGTEIILPADFELDGASIPRLFWGILSPVGLLLIPGLIHDYTEVLGGRGASPQLRERQRDEFAGNL